MAWLALLPLAIVLLGAMSAAVSTQPKNYQSATLTLIDGTGTPITLVVQLTNGDLKWGGIQQHLNKAVIYMARTLIVGVGRGAPEPPTWTITCKHLNIVGSATTGTGTATEFSTGKGAYSANLSTLGASREITCDAKWTIEGTAWGDANDETVTFEDSLITISGDEGEENKITISGQCLGNVVVVNGSNTVTYAQAA